MYRDLETCYPEDEFENETGFRVKFIFRVAEQQESNTALGAWTRPLPTNVSLPERLALPPMQENSIARKINNLTLVEAD